MTPNFFTEGSPYLQHPLLTADRSSAEVDFMLEQLNLPVNGRILDIGCGFGRHSIELAQRGYQATGIDPFLGMIEAARERATGATVSPEFHCLKAEEFQTNALFDGAICLFTTLGQMDEYGDNRGLLQTMKASLKSGGRFLIEVPQKSVAITNFKPDDRFGNETHYTDIVRKLDLPDGIMTETFTLVAPEKRRRYLLRYRLFSNADLRKLLAKAGLTVVAEFADYAGAPLTEGSPFQLILGEA